MKPEHLLLGAVLAFTLTLLVPAAIYWVMQPRKASVDRTPELVIALSAFGLGCVLILLAV